MNTLIIYAHPWDGSFNNHVLNTVVNLKKETSNVDVIDLNKDGFNPVMTANDLKVFTKGDYADELAIKYVERLKCADELIIIFPIWWYGEPAILKGFYDKVLLKGHVYDQVDHNIQGMLNIEKATILTTANIDETVFKFLGDPVQNVLANGILKTIGVKDSKWIHCAQVHDEAHRTEYLEKINKEFSK